MISTESPDKLYLAKNAGPLHVGICDDMLIASSDANKKVIELERLLALSES